MPDADLNLLAVCSALMWGCPVTLCYENIAVFWEKLDVVFQKPTRVEPVEFSSSSTTTSWSTCSPMLVSEPRKWKHFQLWAHPNLDSLCFVYIISLHHHLGNCFMQRAHFYRLHCEHCIIYWVCFYHMLFALSDRINK